jgi:hypothetical protein
MSIVHCANCRKELGPYGEHEGHEMGTPSGYADDYIFCDSCASSAKIHFEIACRHDGGMVSDPECKGSEAHGIPHTCCYSKEQLKASYEAFRHYS